MKMGSAPQPAAAPAPPDPIRIPNKNDPDVLAGRTAKAQTEFANRRGRQSTQLAMGDDTTYRRTTLG